MKIASTDISTLVIILLLLLTTPIKAQLDSNFITKLPINITQYQFVGTPNIGDTIDLNVTFQANLTTVIETILKFDNKVQIIDTVNDTNFVLDTLILDSGQNYSLSYRFIILEQGFGDITFYCKTVNEIIEYDNIVMRKTSIKYDQFNGEYIISPTNDDDNTRIIYNEVYESLGGVGGQQVFRVEGKVVYTNWWDGPPESRPTYPELRLWFKRNNGNQYYDYRLFHPINPASNYIIGTHYAQCDKDGNFIFEFTIPNGGINPTDNLEIWILACKENETVDLYSGTEHKKVILINQNQQMYKRCFLLDYEMMKISVDPNSNYHNYDLRETPIQINDADGQIIRYMTIGRNFIFNRLDGILNFSLPQVTTERKNKIEGGPSGTYFRYNNNTKSIIKLWDYKQAVVLHEYSHYIHHAMSNFDCYGYCGTMEKTEGFGRFLPCAISAWASHVETYNDIFNYNKNSEYRPFLYESDPKNIQNNYRFGFKDGLDYLTHAEFECYLWNIYDSYDDGLFKPEQFINYDNDDVSGLSENLIRQFVINSSTQNSIWEFHNFFKSTVVDPELKASIDKIKDCMSAGNIPIENVPKMRAAQIKNSSSSYNELNHSVTLNWTYQNYDAGVSYRNFPIGVRVYVWANNQWNILSELNPSATSITIELGGDPTGTTANYKVTTYNLSGDSYQPIEYFFDWTYEGGKANSVNTETKNLKVYLYPNPSNIQINIDFELYSSANIKVDIYDNNLSIIKNLREEFYFSGQHSMKIEIGNSLTNGCYFIAFNSNNSISNSIEFIKFIKTDN